MPTNVTAEYKKAEQAFRQARDPHERLVCLKEMLRTLPKHKGTEHLQADIKSRIKGLSEALEGPKRGANRTGPLYTIRSEGAAQIGLIGPPNAGKSSLHGRLTGSHAEVGPYPYTTKLPLPGMLAFEDVHFQLIDLPPIAVAYMEPWMGSALEHADAACLVVDLSDPECLEQVTAVCARLTDKKIILTGHWPDVALRRGSATPLSAGQKDHEVRDDDFSDPFRIPLPTLLIANKSDLDPDPDDVKALEELLGLRFPALGTSTKTGQGLDALGATLFRGLGIVRVYTKAPGRPADRGRPFAVRRGATVVDIARLVHKDLAQTLKFARIWGSAQFDGQHVGPDHPVADRDIVELHAQ